MRTTRLARLVALVGFVGLAAALSGTTASSAPPDDLVVMTSGAFLAPYKTLVPNFSQTSGVHVVTSATAMGVGAQSIPSRVAAGETVDVIIVAGDALQKMIADGFVVAGSRTDLARSSIAMAVRKGAPKPDISTVDALKRTLLSAASVAYSSSVSGVYLAQDLFPRLGIAREMQAKAKRIEGEPVGEVVARGDAELGFQQVSELKSVPGIEIVGLLPGDTQRATIFAGGVSVSSKHPESARALLAFLASAAARAAITDAGLEPIGGAKGVATARVGRVQHNPRVVLKSSRGQARGIGFGFALRQY